MPYIKNNKISRILRLSVANKVLLFVTISTFLTALLVSGFFFNQTSKNVTQIQLDQLATESRILSPHFLASFSELHHDVLLLSKMPPIRGLMRSENNNGIDPFDGSTSKLWRERLESIFTSVLTSKPSYSQIRYIGIADKGRELVRVDRKNNAVIAIPENRLQQKGDEFYFKEALEIDPSGVYYSTVSLNRENGKIQEPFLPVIRTIVPVYNGNDIYGMIVINASYEDILKSVIDELEIDKSLYIINESGDFIIFDPEKKNAAFNFRTLNQETDNNSVAHTIFKHNKNNKNIKARENIITAMINGEKNIVHYNKQYFNPSNPEQFLVTAISVPEKFIFAPVHKAERQTILLGFGLIIFVFFCSAYFASILTKPLKNMAKEIENYDDKNKDINLPVFLRDEIGALARAFKDLMQKQKMANQELEEFSYRTSHDLRSPLVSSIGLLDFAEKAIESGQTDQAKQSVNLVKKSLNKLEILIKDILNLTKAKNLEETVQKINIGEIIDSALEKFSHMENFDRLEIEKNLAFDNDLISKKNHIRLIVENLISNAIKYQDLEKEKSYLKIKTTQNNGNFIFEVEDNGLGIPEDQREKLFAMFSRLHPKTSFGSGLGLYMIKKSAEILEGHIYCKPITEGACFKLEIPLQPLTSKS